MYVARILTRLIHENKILIQFDILISRLSTELSSSPHHYSVGRAFLLMLWLVHLSHWVGKASGKRLQYTRTSRVSIVDQPAPATSLLFLFSRSLLRVCPTDIVNFILRAHSSGANRFHAHFPSPSTLFFLLAFFLFFFPFLRLILFLSFLGP